MPRKPTESAAEMILRAAALLLLAGAVVAFAIGAAVGVLLR